MKKSILSKMALFLAFGLFFSLISQAEAKTEDAAKFYKGERVTIEAGPAGSGVDLGARLFAKYFEEITGARVIVQNHSEVGGLKAINVAYRAKPDGLTIGCHNISTIVQNRLLKEPSAMYDLDKLSFIGSSIMAPMALWVDPNGPYATLEKFRTGKGILQAGASKLGYMAFWGTLAAHLLEMDFKTIIGVGGPPAAKMSVMRRETHFTNIATHTAGIAPDLTPILLVSKERHHLNPDVPTIAEVVDLNEKQMNMLTFADIAGQYSGAGFVFPPGVPQDRVAYVQQIFADIAARDDLAAEAKKLFGLWGYHNAKELNQTIQFCIDREAQLEEIRQLVEKYYL